MLGLIDIRTIFGESAVRRRMPIKLIVHLVGRRTMEDSYERLPLQALTETILGIPVRKVAIPVAAGRNIAVLTETAVRTTVLLLRGIDTTREFARRQQALILDQSETPHHFCIRALQCQWLCNCNCNRGGNKKYCCLQRYIVK